MRHLRNDLLHLARGLPLSQGVPLGPGRFRRIVLDLGELTRRFDALLIGSLWVGRSGAQAVTFAPNRPRGIDRG
jgi:hypothetical protein